MTNEIAPIQSLIPSASPTLKIVAGTAPKVAITTPLAFRTSWTFSRCTRHPRCAHEILPLALLCHRTRPQYTDDPSGIPVSFSWGREHAGMNQFPCLIRSSTPGGESRFALGDPLVDQPLRLAAAVTTRIPLGLLRRDSKWPGAAAQGRSGETLNVAG